jgi:hypothetical protein
MQLVFGPVFEFEGIHESDEALSGFGDPFAVRGSIGG